MNTWELGQHRVLQDTAEEPDWLEWLGGYRVHAIHRDSVCDWGCRQGILKVGGYIYKVRMVRGYHWPLVAGGTVRRALSSGLSAFWAVRGASCPQISTAALEIFWLARR